MTLGSDLTGARIILYGNPATGNDWYGLGMNGGCINYNNVATGTHKFYCGTAVAATINSTTATFNTPVTFTGSTTVNQTSATLPTTGAQIGFVYSGKPTGLQQIGGWVVTTSATAITALAYPIPAIGVWMCVFQATPNGFNTNGTQILNYGLSVNPTSMDSSWPYQSCYGFATQVHYTRIFTVTNLTTTIYPIAFVDISNGNQGLLNYTLQCVRIA
jgi:hypothetical protein